MIRKQGAGGLLTVEEAADALGLKEATIRSWTMRRKLSYVRLSKRCVRIPAEEVKRLIRENLVAARDAQR
jgi:excisionase family DNA binding protein